MQTDQIWLDDLKIAYTDDPDPEQAGLGMVCLPLIKRALTNGDMRYWSMSPAEQMALVFLLEQLRPKVAIEIGTRFGGSLQVLSKYSECVYAIDIDPDVPTRLGQAFPNVQYLIGPSDDVLPRLIERIQRNGSDLAFALVDGDHSADGVRKDINHLLRFRPTVPLYIVMHDSFNPECRSGLRSADWSSNSCVRAVELDFVPGVVNPVPAFRDQLWGGMALAILTPTARTGRFEITGRAERTFQTAMQSLTPAPKHISKATRLLKSALRLRITRPVRAA